jgi:hypothetical protein
MYIICGLLIGLVCSLAGWLFGFYIGARWEQKERTITKEELWNLDVTIAEFVHPRLVKFRNTCHDLPLDEVDDMIFAFEKYLDQDYPKCINTNTREGRRIRRGMHLFYKNFTSLWN